MFDNPNTNVRLEGDSQVAANLPDFSDSIMSRPFQVAAVGDGGDRSINQQQLRQNLSRHEIMRSVPDEHKERVLDIVSRFAAGDQSGFNFEDLTEGRFENLKLNGLGNAVNQVLTRFGYGLRVQWGGHTIDALTIRHPSGQVYKEFRRNTVPPTYYEGFRRRATEGHNDNSFAESIRNQLSGRGSSLQHRRA